MFDEGSLKRLLALHEKTFGLFRWLNNSLRKGRPPLSAVADALAFSDAAEKWLRTNRPGIPEDFRPTDSELEEFSHLFVSYLSTSFEVIDRSLVRACPGCFCCVYWLENKHLRARDPDRKARAVAHDLKILCLRALAGELGLSSTDEALNRFIGGNKGLAPQLSLLSYAHELKRRSRYASQGEGVLALWREIAWDKGRKPDRKFKLKPEKILAAESALKEKLGRA